MDTTLPGDPLVGDPEQPLHTPQAGDSPVSQPETPPKQTRTSDEYEQMIRKLRDENAATRVKLRTFEEEQKKRADAELTEIERLKNRTAELETLYNTSVEEQFEFHVNQAIEREALKAGVNPKHLDKISKLIDWDGVDIDDDGNILNVAELVKNIATDTPEWFESANPPQQRQTPTSGGATNPSRTQSGAARDLSWDYIAELASKDPQQYMARRAEIQAWMGRPENSMRYGRKYS